MYRMGMMTFLLDGKTELDRTKCMELGIYHFYMFSSRMYFKTFRFHILALVHDLAESIVGDITPLCGVPKEEKQRRELAAMREISSLIPPQGDHLIELFEVRCLFCSLKVCNSFTCSSLTF